MLNYAKCLTNHINGSSKSFPDVAFLKYFMNLNFWSTKTKTSWESWWNRLLREDFVLLDLIKFCYNLLDHENSSFSKKPEKLTLFNWTQQLATALIENVKPTPKPKTGQPFTEPTHNVCFFPKNSRKSHYLVEVPDYIQFDNFEHWPIHQCERSGCFLCKQKKRILLDNREELFQWFFWG